MCFKFICRQEVCLLFWFFFLLRSLLKLRTIFFYAVEKNRKPKYFQVTNAIIHTPAISDDPFKRYYERADQDGRNRQHSGGSKMPFGIHTPKCHIRVTYPTRGGSLCHQESFKDVSSRCSHRCRLTMCSLPRDRVLTGGTYSCLYHTGSSKSPSFQSTHRTGSGKVNEGSHPEIIGWVTSHFE